MATQRRKPVIDYSKIKQRTEKISHALGTEAQAPVANKRFIDRLAAYAILTRQNRPIGWLLLLWPTYWALWLAAEALPPARLLAIFTLGVIVMRSAGCIINDYADQWLDGQVSRTRHRPLVTGEVGKAEALCLFSFLIAIAAALAASTNRYVMMLSVPALALATIYPFLKRYTYLPQVGLGMAFGMAIPMAFSAVLEDWPPTLAWVLFSANVLWTTAYDTYYGMVDREDDLLAGAKSIAILFGELDLVAIGLMQACFLATMALVGFRAELGWGFAAACAAAALLFVYQNRLGRRREPENCFKAFMNNNYAGFVIFLGIALDLWHRS